VGYWYMLMSYDKLVGFLRLETPVSVYCPSSFAVFILHRHLIK
jgi:hypothetical protein